MNENTENAEIEKVAEPAYDFQADVLARLAELERKQALIVAAIHPTKLPGL